MGALIAWFVAALFFLLYVRAVARLHRKRREAEFWQRMAKYAAVGAGLGWLGFFTHRKANSEFALENSDIRRRRDELAEDLDRLSAENADFRKQLNLPEHE